MSHRRILCAIFTKFSLIVGSFILDHVLKLGEIRYRGSGQNWGLNLWGQVTPKYIQCPLVTKLCVRPKRFWRCKNMLKVPYHRAKFV